MYTCPRNTKYEKPLFAGNYPLRKSFYIKLKHPSFYYRSSRINKKNSTKEYDTKTLTYWRMLRSCIRRGTSLYEYKEVSALYGFKAKSLYMTYLYRDKK